MASTSGPPVTEPIPIYKLAHRILLYDINVVTYLRREHNISGVLIGTLPQASQQNVFLGLPLELMPEEARVLVEKNAAYIVDDVAEHKQNFLAGGLSEEEKKAYASALRKQGQAAAAEQARKSTERKKNALKKQGTENWNDIPDDMFQPRQGRAPRKPRNRDIKEEATPAGSDSEDGNLFGSQASSAPPKATHSPAPSDAATAGLEPHGVTPTTSAPPLQPRKPDNSKAMPLPSVPKSYPLYKHMHENGYFMAPGLRFGCQYMAYPGDPLRFHSHFLCNGMEWDQEFDLLDLVGGGRLGTGVKKGFLIGGEAQDDASVKDEKSKVRTFCIEWGSM